jgi:putative phosphoesterase
MLIGIVSDTHGHLEHTRAALSVLQERDVELVLHCGDIGSVDIVPLFDAWPTHFVFGNVDSHEDRLRHAIDSAGQTCHGRFGSLECEGRRIALLHGDDERRLRETVGGEEWDLVCYGHTHVAESHKEGRTLVLNPGALYRATPHSFAIVELPSMQVSTIEVV